MFMVVGLKYGYTDASDKRANRTLQAHSGFGKTIYRKRFDYMRELLGLSIKHDNPIPGDRKENYQKKRPCAELVEQAARMLDEYILSKKNGGENYD